MIAFTELVQGIDLLTPPPAVAGRLARIARDQRTGISEVVTVVRYDATLTGGLLAYANGAAESAGGSIADLQDAIARLGVPKILTLAVMSHAAPMMMAALPAYGLSEGEVWRHALASAHAVEILQRRTPARIAPAAMTAAFLHDVGKFVLEPHLDEGRKQELARCVGAGRAVFPQAELEILGFSHATIGARVAQQWNLGPEIVTAIRKHHELGSSQDPAVDAVRISNLAAKAVGCGLGLEGMNLGADAGACGRLGLTGQDFESICAELAASLPDILSHCDSMTRSHQ